LKFVRAERDLGRQSRPEQHRHGNESTATRNRIDEPSTKTGEEKCPINQRIEVHGRGEFGSGTRMTCAFYNLLFCARAKAIK
jgi:hypothetical protein